VCGRWVCGPLDEADITSFRIAVAVVVCAAVVVWAAAVEALEPAVTISNAQPDEHGVLAHEVRSPYQAGTTQIRVLLPSELEQGRRYPVVYLLPVEAGTGNRYGDGLLEVRGHGLADRHGVIFVAPTFSHLPWYADHPTDPEIRQETYFLRVVLPFVEEQYAALAERDGRLLLGFSKSGWGAFALVLRHPEVFGKAAAWDAPLAMEKPDRYGMGEIFATEENFQRYQITRLLEQAGPDLRVQTRLVLLGYGNFRAQHHETHELMNRLGIPHHCRDGPQRKHDWHSGWVEEALELLFEERRR